MNQHPVDAARIIMESEEELELAAVVAYEHHIMLNGGGYPTVHYNRECTLASRLVHVCDVFDALRTNRPYREAWPTDRVLTTLEEGAGSEFDPDLTRAFVQMIRAWEGKVLYLEHEEDKIGGPEGVPAGTEGPIPVAPPAAAGDDEVEDISEQEGDEVEDISEPEGDAAAEDISEDEDVEVDLETLAAEIGGDEDDDLSWDE